MKNLEVQNVTDLFDSAPAQASGFFTSPTQDNRTIALNQPYQTDWEGLPFGNSQAILGSRRAGDRLWL